MVVAVLEGDMGENQPTNQAGVLYLRSTSVLHQGALEPVSLMGMNCSP